MFIHKILAEFLHSARCILTAHKYQPNKTASKYTIMNQQPRSPCDAFWWVCMRKCVGDVSICWDFNDAAARRTKSPARGNRRTICVNACLLVCFIINIIAGRTAFTSHTSPVIYFIHKPVGTLRCLLWLTRKHTLQRRIFCFSFFVFAFYKKATFKSNQMQWRSKCEINKMFIICVVFIKLSIYCLNMVALNWI